VGTIVHVNLADAKVWKEHANVNLVVSVYAATIANANLRKILHLAARERK